MAQITGAIVVLSRALLVSAGGIVDAIVAGGDGSFPRGAGIIVGIIGFVLINRGMDERPSGEKVSERKA